MNPEMMIGNPTSADLLKPDQAAAWLGISVSTLRRIVHAGGLTPHTIGRRRRFRLADLSAYVEAGREVKAPAPPGNPMTAAPRPRPDRSSPPLPSPLAVSLNRPGRKSFNPFSDKYRDG